MELKPGYKQTEVGVIPEDWEVVSLGIVVSVEGGYAFSSKKFIGSGKYQVVKMSNLYGGVLNLDRSASFLNDLDLKEEHYRLNENDIIITLTGTVGKRDYGYSYRISHEQNLLLNQRVGRLISGERANASYLSFQLKTSSFFRQFFDSAKGGTGNQANVGKKDIELITIALPSLPEQEAIAEALSDADALIESLEQLIAKKRRIKQGAMQELLTGKKRLPGFSEEWRVKTLGEIGESLIGLTYKPSDVRPSGLLVLRSSNVFESALRFEDNVYVEMDVPERIIVRKGDILICVRNGSRDLIGKCAWIDERAQGMTFGAFMAVFRTPFHSFVYHQFQSDTIKRQIHEHLGATINQITNKSLNSFQIPFPVDYEEQETIAEVLSDMDAEIAALETKLDKYRRIKQGMMHNLLTGRVRLV